MVTRRLTDAQVEARDVRRAAFQRLVHDVAHMSEADRQALAARMSATTVDGHPLSIHNACLLASQRPNASIVGGFRQWLAHGRVVRKGEHGATIWAPRKGARAEGEEPTEANPRPSFIPVSVFDISQTDERTASET